jgi:hypothetical protein
VEVWWAGTGANRSGQADREECANTEVHTRTAQNGTFELPGKRGFGRVYPSFPHNCQRRWNICVRHGSEDRSLNVFVITEVCGNGGPPNIQTECELSRPDIVACMLGFGSVRPNKALQLTGLRLP